MNRHLWTILIGVGVIIAAVCVVILIWRPFESSIASGRMNVHGKTVSYRIFVEGDTLYGHVWDDTRAQTLVALVYIEPNGPDDPEPNPQALSHADVEDARIFVDSSRFEIQCEIGGQTWTLDLQTQQWDFPGSEEPERLLFGTESSKTK